MYETLTINEHICREMLEENRTCENRREDSSLKYLTLHEWHWYKSVVYRLIDYRKINVAQRRYSSSVSVCLSCTLSLETRDVSRDVSLKQKPRLSRTRNFESHQNRDFRDREISRVTKIEKFSRFLENREPGSHLCLKHMVPNIRSF